MPTSTSINQSVKTFNTCFNSAVGAHSHSVFVEVKTVFIEINCNLQLTYNND